MAAIPACIMLGVALAGNIHIRRCAKSGPSAGSWKHRRPEIYELKGQYYQVIGHAWDHEVKDFKVVYRPLYHCDAAKDRFEAHTMAVSHFSRWEEKFKRVPAHEIRRLPKSVTTLILDGPFDFDPEWSQCRRTLPASPTISQRSGLGTRSHEVASLEQIIGDYQGFIEEVHRRLQCKGIDALKRSYEMDHICFRCETVDQYQQVVSALVPSFGESLVECMIGGRPISTIRLHRPICHAGFKVTCIEVPCPKAGRGYKSGLEHAELVVGQALDGVKGTARIRAFVKNCKAEGLDLEFDERALSKGINADVSVTLPPPEGTPPSPLQPSLGPIAVKFHQRPLYEVVDYELKQGSVELVPEDYFSQ
eukprot:CAMPEP_0197844766 /NCGR_PEP_ID=MMETSP1438-20131217/1742_1 /TAXON_ID=1461541 /ORGANISM="Pterosperma sp., Strain CCMP1384" /LENGTH=362 /DNA_ID=CAMNT_0043455729 /DNA_START=67 /DNA_END=1155 /DNA_ORIENTATION=+